MDCIIILFFLKIKYIVYINCIRLFMDVARFAPAKSETTCKDEIRNAYKMCEIIYGCKAFCIGCK